MNTYQFWVENENGIVEKVISYIAAENKDDAWLKFDEITNNKYKDIDRYRFCFQNYDFNYKEESAV